MIYIYFDYIFYTNWHNFMFEFSNNLIFTYLTFKIIIMCIIYKSTQKTDFTIFN